MALRSRPLDAQVPSKGWSIRHRLMLLALALALALPFILLTAGIVRQLADNQRETRREAILFSTRTLMNAVDTIVNKQVTMAQMLATSPTLQTDDLSALRKEAERASPGLSDGWIVLSDQDGQQLVNLSRPEGEALPRRPPGAGRTRTTTPRAGNRPVPDLRIFHRGARADAGGHGGSPGPTQRQACARADDGHAAERLPHVVRGAEPVGGMARRP